MELNIIRQEWLVTDLYRAEITKTHFLNEAALRLSKSTCAQQEIDCYKAVLQSCRGIHELKFPK